MTYIVCQTPKCQQTYPLSQFDKDSVNVSCEKCGGVLIDKNGRANLSKNPTVIPVITAEEVEANRKRRLEEKRKQLNSLQAEVAELEKEED